MLIITQGLVLQVRCNECRKKYRIYFCDRGYHVYKRYWQPKEAERLECLHEVDNPFDVFAIKTANSDKVITGHLPREISRVTKFLLDRETVAYAELTSTHYRRSPIMQSCLEISCKVTVKLHAFGSIHAAC